MGQALVVHWAHYGTFWEAAVLPVCTTAGITKKVLEPDDSPAPSEKPPRFPSLGLQKGSFLSLRDISKLNHRVFSVLFSIHKRSLALMKYADLSQYLADCSEIQGTALSGS